MRPLKHLNSQANPRDHRALSREQPAGVWLTARGDDRSSDLDILVDRRGTLTLIDLARLELLESLLG